MLMQKQTNLRLIKELLKEYKGGKDEALGDIIIAFKPLILAYARKTGWKFDKDDMESILVIKLIEVIKRMPIIDDEAKLITFIATTIKNHFLNVIKKINRIQDNECELEADYLNGFNQFNDIIFNDMIDNLDTKKQKIITLKFFHMYTDKEIADELKISRQAVHKQLKKIYEILIKAYLKETS